MKVIIAEGNKKHNKSCKTVWFGYLCDKILNSLFVSDEMRAGTFMRKCNDIGFDKNTMASNKFAYVNSFTIEGLKNILNQNIGLKKVFVDVFGFISNNTIGV